jgi:hypothetical protein
MKLATFGVLCHSKYLQHLRGLTMHEIMEAIMKTNSSKKLFYFVSEEWHVEVFDGSEEEFYEAAHTHLLQSVRTTLGTPER